MTINYPISVKGLDIEDIRTNLEIAFKDSDFNDYNYNGSALSVILDLLSTDTYQSAFYTNMVFNEAFLDSATKRDNVLSRAKELGYLPRSAIGSQIEINITIVPEDSPNFITIPKNTLFNGILGNEYFNFYTNEDYILTNNNGIYTQTITIKEGILLQQTTTVTSYDKYFVVRLINQNIDLSTLEVIVKDDINSLNTTVWNRIENILEADNNTLGFFIEETAQGYYDLIFGNDIIGKKLQINNVITCNYKVTNGVKCNNITSITSPTTIQGYRNIHITIAVPGVGGYDVEDIDSIKYNAPKSYTIQERTITAGDYRQKIYEAFPDIQSINTWGGEDNNIPMYGRTIICAKPYGGYLISNRKKQDIIKYLRTLQPVGPAPIFVDADSKIIVPYITIEYDKTKSSITLSNLMSVITYAIQNYSDKSLGQFGGIFYISRFETEIDNVDNSIVSNETNIELSKIFIPELNTSASYSIDFHQKIFHPYDGHLGSLYSSGFKFSNYRDTIYLEDDGVGNIRSYYMSHQQKVYIKNEGTIDYNTGHISLDRFSPIDITGQYMSINIIPHSKNITSVRNEVLEILYSQIRIYDVFTGNLIAQANPSLGNISLLNNLYAGPIGV
jgi:hypothetical protein